MMELELGELVKKFQAIQHQEVPNQISERNVVEIINVLRRRKLVDVLYTVDGKEYLTWDQLQREVVDEILINGGRMNVLDLPGSLNVHATHIESVLPKVLEDPTIRVESGELMTDEYLDSTVRAAADGLKERGFLAIAEFAKSHRFASIFAQKILREAVESRKLHAVADGNAMYTRQFVRAQMTVARSGLVAATRPVNLVSFFERHHLFLPLMDTIMHAVQAELPGRMDGQVYVPAFFEAARAEQVDNVYLSNGYIEYSTLHRQGISQAREFLTMRYNPVLDRAQMGAVTVASEVSRRRGRRGQTTGAVSTVSVVRTEAHPNAGHALTNCFISDKFLANLVFFEDLVQGDALALDLALHLPAAIEFERDSDILLKRLRELHPIIISCTVLSGGILIHESVFGVVKGQLHAALDASLKQGGGKGSRKQKSRAEFGDKEEEVFLNILSRVTGLPQEQYQEALMELSSHWNEMARDTYNEVATTVEQHTSVDLKRIRTGLQTSLGVAWVQLSIAAKGVMWSKAQIDENAYIAVNRHLLTTRGFPVVHDILLNESLDSEDLYSSVCSAMGVEQQRPQPTAATLQKGLEVFNERQRRVLLPLVEAVNGKSVEKFKYILQEMCSSGEIAISTFYQPNKKIERESLAVLRTGLLTRVEGDSFTADAAHNAALFASVCSLLVHARFHVHLELPGRAVGSVVARLLREAPVIEALQDCHLLITGAIGGKELSAEDIEKLELLRRASLDGKSSAVEMYDALVQKGVLSGDPKQREMAQACTPLLNTISSLGKKGVSTDISVMHDTSTINSTNSGRKTTVNSVFSSCSTVRDKIQRVLSSLLCYVRPGCATRELGICWPENLGVDQKSGIYLWGGVGIGKTVVMDLFELCETPCFTKRRAHLHSFMTEIVSRLHKAEKAARGTHVSPIELVVEDVLRESQILCLDEFQTFDVTHASLLAAFFSLAFPRGLIMFTTSNRPPHELTTVSTAFDRFVPLICRYCDVIHCDVVKDYRENASKSHHDDLFLFPNTVENAKLLVRRVERGFEGGCTWVRNASIWLYQRELVVPFHCSGVALFDFSDICGPLGPPDFQCIARHFHSIIITNIPQIGVVSKNAAQQFVILVDELYQYNVKLLFTSEVPWECLFDRSVASGATTEGDSCYTEGEDERSSYSSYYNFRNKEEVLSFDRIASRLKEMGCRHYMLRDHRHFVISDYNLAALLE